MAKNSARDFIHDVLIFQIIVALLSALVWWFAKDRTVIGGVEAIAGWVFTLNMTLLGQLAYVMNTLVDKVNDNTELIKENSDGIEILHNLSESNRLQSKVPGVKERQKDILRHLKGLAGGVVYVNNRWDMYEQDILNIHYVSQVSGIFKATVPISINEYEIQLTEDGFKRFINKQFEVVQNGNMKVQRLYLFPDDFKWKDQRVIIEHFQECLREGLEIKTLQLKYSQVEDMKDIVIFNNSRISTSRFRNDSLFKTTAVYTSDKHELQDNIKKFEALWTNPKAVLYNNKTTENIH